MEKNTLEDYETALRIYEEYKQGMDGSLTTYTKWLESKLTPKQATQDWECIDDSWPFLSWTIGSVHSYRDDDGDDSVDYLKFPYHFKKIEPAQPEPEEHKIITDSGYININTEGKIKTVVVDGLTVWTKLVKPEPAPKADAYTMQDALKELEEWGDNGCMFNDFDIIIDRMKAAAQTETSYREALEAALQHLDEGCSFTAKDIIREALGQ